MIKRLVRTFARFQRMWETCWRLITISLEIAAFAPVSNEVLHWDCV